MPSVDITLSAVGGVEKLGQAEVKDFHVAVRPQHDVFRLDVAVHDPTRVRSRQCARDLTRDHEGFIDRQRAALEPLPQRLAIDELADDEGSAVHIAEIVDDEDVRMVERRRGDALRHGTGAGDRRRWRPSSGSSFSATGRSSFVSCAL